MINLIDKTGHKFRQVVVFFSVFRLKTPLEYYHDVNSMVAIALKS